MKRLNTRRWFAWLALVGLITQAGLPTLRVATASAGELRAEAVLATALCSKPTLNVADRIAALLNPWKQHSSKVKYQHCDSCLHSIDAPVAMASEVGDVALSSVSNHSASKLPGVWFASPLNLVPPSRAPPVLS
jgi:hypothetical protein